MEYRIFAVLAKAELYVTQSCIILQDDRHHS